jgi:hypothetical protein
MCCGSDAPTPDPLIGQAAKANADVAKEALSFYKDLYTTELLPMQKEQQALGRTLVDRYLSSMDKQEKFADEQNATYKATFQPVEQQMVRDAMGYDSQENIARRSGIAAANVEQQMSNAVQENNRNLSRYGLNPNSSAFAQTNERLMREGALQKAGAATGAAFDTMDRGIALRAGAANFGRNMPNTAAAYYTNANGAGGNAMNTSTQAINTANNNANTMGNGFNSFYQGNTGAGNLMLGDFGARMQGYSADQSAKGGMYSGIGTIVGMGLSKGGAFAALADGGQPHEGAGPVRGIGGPVDDKIPAMLSNGEYVIPADVVRAKGVEFFDKLKDRYHTPAAVQRRQALSRG